MSRPKNKQSDAEKAAEEYAQSLTRVEPARFTRSDIEFAFYSGAAWAAPKWVSVKESLPKPYVLVIGLIGAKLSPDIGVYDKEFKSFSCGKFGDIGIEFLEFWMPLPAAPEGANES